MSWLRLVLNVWVYKVQDRTVHLWSSCCTSLNQKESSAQSHILWSVCQAVSDPWGGVYWHYCAFFSLAAAESFFNALEKSKKVIINPAGSRWFHHPSSTTTIHHNNWSLKAVMALLYLNTDEGLNCSPYCLKQVWTTGLQQLRFFLIYLFIALLFCAAGCDPGFSLNVPSWSMFESLKCTRKGEIWRIYYILSKVFLPMMYKRDITNREWKQDSVNM